MEAQKTIVISSPVISGPKVHELIDTLAEKEKLGVTVTMAIWEPDACGFGNGSYWMQMHEEMRQAGFYI